MRFRTREPRTTGQVPEKYPAKSRLRAERGPRITPHRANFRAPVTKRQTHTCLTKHGQPDPPRTCALKRTERSPYMPTSPKNTEEKIERMLNAWRALAPNKNFGGMTLAQFEALAGPSLDARRLIDDLDNRRTQATAERDRADEAFNARAQLVVAGVLADPTE